MSAPSQHDDLQVLAGLIVRGGLVVAAGVATAVEAPAWLRSTLALFALAAILDLVIRRHATGGRTAVLVAVAGCLTGVLGVGLALDLVPTGLDPTGWAIGLTVLGLLVLGLLGRGPLRPRPDLRDVVRLDGFWYAGAALLVVAGLVLAVTVTERAEGFPVELSAVTAASGEVTVSIASPEEAGPFDVWLEDGDTQTVLRTAISVPAGRPLAIPVPRAGDRQMRISLRDTGSTSDLRFVIVNPGAPVTAG